MRSRVRFVFPRRAAALVLLLALLFAPSARGEAFRPSGEADARRKAVSLLLRCALRPEYGPDLQPLTRWGREVTVWAGGSPTREDLAVLDGFLRDLNLRVSSFPGARRVRRDSEASVRVWFVPEYMMKYYFSDYQEGNWGFFTFQTERSVIVSARVGIASDVTDQPQRNHLILEELVGALGLPGDHLVYSDSILYDRWTETQALSQVDWLMLDLLYSPALSPGMTEDQVRAALKAK